MRADCHDQAAPDRVEVLAAAAFAGMGAIALAHPAAIPRWMGLDIREPGGAGEVRAVYGGFGLVTAGSLLRGPSAARAGARRAAGLALLGMAGGRVVDLVARRRPSTAGLLALAGEALIGRALLGGRDS